MNIQQNPLANPLPFRSNPHTSPHIPSTAFFSCGSAQAFPEALVPASIEWFMLLDGSLSVEDPRLRSSDQSPRFLVTKNRQFFYVLEKEQKKR